MALLKNLKKLRRRRKAKKKKDYTLFGIIKTQAKEFCLSTDLHGYKYIGQSKRPTIERFVWCLIVFSLLCYSIVLMKVAYDYNTSRSTLTIMESTHHGIWNFPFPAVTICNVNQISLKKARNFVGNLQTLNGMNEEYVLSEMRLLLEMLDPGVFGYDVGLNLTLLQNLFDANNYSAAEVMGLVKQDCAVLIKNCKWKGNATSCENIFEDILGRDGHCCSFNYFHARSRIHNNGTPLKLSSCGYQTGLTFEVHPEPQDYFATLYGSYGVKAMIHGPYNFPVRSSEYQLIGLGVQNFLSVSPEQTYATKAFSRLPMSARKCVFDENGLPDNLLKAKRDYGMLQYNFVNCMHYCRARVAYEECGCVPHYQPQNVTRTCDLRDLGCLKRKRDVYDITWPGMEIDSLDIPFLNLDWTSTKPCGCQLDCNAHKYPIDSTQGPLNKDFVGDSNANLTRNFGNYSLVNVFYTDLVAIQYRKNVYIDWKYIFAGFGGLLSLFVGFNITNSLELVYFFVIRAIIDSYTRRRRRIRFQNLIKN